MRSTELGPESHDRSDVTARSRIRDAAIRLFGARGYTATSVRAIADEAGASPALVLHHFGSKERLREACDDHVLQSVIGKGDDLADADLIGTMHGWLSDPQRFQSSFDYVARTLTERSTLGAQLFDRLVAKTRDLIADGVARGTMRASVDPEMQALVVALHGLAPIVLQRQIGRLLGEFALGASVIQRMTLPTLELYSHGLYTDDSYLDAASQALGRLTP